MVFGGQNLAEEKADVAIDAGVVVEAMGRGAEGDDREVAVVAASAAEREVDVGGGGRGGEGCGGG